MRSLLPQTNHNFLSYTYSTTTFTSTKKIQEQTHTKKVSFYPATLVDGYGLLDLPENHQVQYRRPDEKTCTHVVYVIHTCNTQ